MNQAERRTNFIIRPKTEMQHSATQRDRMRPFIVPNKYRQDDEAGPTFGNKRNNGIQYKICWFSNKSRGTKHYPPMASVQVLRQMEEQTNVGRASIERPAYALVHPPASQTTNLEVDSNNLYFLARSMPRSFLSKGWGFKDRRHRNWFPSRTLCTQRRWKIWRYSIARTRHRRDILAKVEVHCEHEKLGHSAPSTSTHPL